MQLTPYQVAKQVNAELAAVGEYPIPTQMVYTYVRKGFIPSNRGRVSSGNALRWVRRFVANRQAARATALSTGSFGQFVDPARW